LTEKWNKRLDDLKTKWDLENDTQLAKVLGISKQAIQQIRTNKTQPSVTTKLIIMDRLGFSNAREILLEVLPESKKKTVIKGWNELTKKLNKADKLDE
jgi:DNA-binding XRE family transcriptional regulator